MIEIIENPWGQEQKWAHTAHYVGKVLKVNPQRRTEYHRENVEPIRFDYL